MTFPEVILLVGIGDSFKRQDRNTIFTFNDNGRLEHAWVKWDEPYQDKLFLDDYRADDWIIIFDLEFDAKARETKFKISSKNQ